jgi:hypothetical protein
MSDLVNHFVDIAEGLKMLSEDVRRMAENKKASSKDNKKYDDQEQPKKSVKLLKMKSLQPVTRIRANKEEIIKAKENPELTYISDKLKDILGGQ